MAEELIENGSIEALHEAVSLRITHLAGAVIELVKAQVHPVRAGILTAELLAVIARDNGNPYPSFFEEEEYLTVEHLSLRAGKLFRDMEETEGIGRVGINHRMYIDLV